MKFLRQGLLLLALTLGLAFQSTAQPTQVIVTMTDGSELVYNMSEADRLYFEDNTNLVIETGNKGTARIALSAIRKISCTEVTGQPENLTAAVSLMPNPAHDAVKLTGLDGVQTVNIYAIDGRLMQSFEATADQTIDISGLPIGLYLVRTQSTTLKMIKL